MSYAKDNQLEAVILSLDFLKCFDNIAHSAVIGALRYFNFANYIVKWTDIIYSDFDAVIQNNGKFTSKFKLEKGIWQGGPASSLYFLICAEVLAIELRSNEHIMGIQVDEFINLLGQFADDMDMYLLYQKESIEEVFEVMEKFKKISGFTISYEKTQIYRIGSLHDSNAQFVLQKQVSWTNNPVNVLGVTISSKESELIELNYKPIMNKIEAILKAWKHRTLSSEAPLLFMSLLLHCDPTLVRVYS